MTTSDTPTSLADHRGGGDDTKYRLPRSVVPRRYALHLSPDLQGASFTGTEQIEIEVLEEVDRIVLNAVDLVVSEPHLLPGWGSETTGETGVALRVEADLGHERIALVVGRAVPPGRYKLVCRFSGTLNDRLRGFYRSTFVDDGGVERVIATTQFEETDARRAFPCFDEPEAKAVFSITLDAPPGTIALSNAAERSSEELEDGTHRTLFRDTITMSTYLVAFVVGPLELTGPVDVDGTAVRVAHVPGRGPLTGPAMEAAAHALRFFASYFDIAYPGDKLDLVALPDFAAGAMENLGCVTFREAILLADPERTGRVELERLIEVVDHELAHMWFGDLVTMRWWNGIWLNEAFATFMALCCQDDYRPDWNVFVGFARGKATALGIDGLHATRPVEFPVEAPEEAAAMFDVLTYEKGASVLWMLEQYIGRDRFRSGVRRYLKAHAFGNTETSDLWDAIEAEAEDVPIRALMESWIFQGGYPLVRAESALGQSGEEVVELRQEPFSYLPVDSAIEDSAIGSDWLVPVLATPVRSRSGAGAGPAAEPLRVLLGTTPEQLPAVAGPLVLNAGGAGFYRLSYDAILCADLLSELESLEPLERYNLLGDTWATVVAGMDRLDSFFAMLGRLSNETDPHVWSVAIGALWLVDLVASDALREGLRASARSILVPHLARVGWTADPDEDEQTPLLRAALVGALGTTANDDSVVARARELFHGEQEGSAPLDPDLASAVLGVVAAHATRDELDSILDRFRRPRDPMDAMRHLYALGRLTDPEMAAEIRSLALVEIRSQNAPYLLGAMLSSRAGGPATWSFMTEHFEEILKRFPDNSIPRMLEGVSGLAQLAADGTPLYAGAVQEFCADRVVGGHRRAIRQSLERLEVNVRFAARVEAELPALVGAP